MTGVPSNRANDQTCIQGGIGTRCSFGGRAAELEPPDQIIARLAERQHGVVARRQLLDLGLGPDAIKVRLRRGSLRKIHLGVYAVGHSVLKVEGRLMAAVLACGPGALLSHFAAARCWGVLRGTGMPEVTRPGKFRQRPGIVARFASIPADERAVRDGIPLTSVPRTIFDLASVASRWQLQRALHEVEVRQLTDRLSVPELLQRYPRRPGAAMLRDLLDLGAAAGAPINDFEDAFGELVERHGLLPPRFNADLVLAGRTFRPDCLWQEQKLIVELDGRAVHATRRAFEADRERDRMLVADGWRVIRVAWTQLRDEPEAVAADVQRALRMTKPASRAV